MSTNFAGIYRTPLKGITGAARSVLLIILTECNHTDNPKFVLNNKPFPLKRGQWISSNSIISELSGLSRQQVRSALKSITQLTILATSTPTSRATLYTIVNVDLFLVKQNEQPAPQPAHATLGNQQLTTNNKEHNNKHNNNNNNNNKQKVTLDELSTSHVSQWLAKKRLLGKYVNHNESDILETFKNYCESKGKKYENFIAAYRNSFEWERNQPKANTITPKLSKHQRARIALGLDSAEPQPTNQVDVTPANLL